MNGSIRSRTLYGCGEVRFDEWMRIYCISYRFTERTYKGFTLIHISDFSITARFPALFIQAYLVHP